VPTLRENLWYKRDFKRKLAAIRSDRQPATLDGQEFVSWGPPVSEIFSSGPAAILSSGSDIEDQARWLKKQNPYYLISLPSNVQALSEVFKESGESLSLFIRS
jgi:hypothetical protein